MTELPTLKRQLTQAREAVRKAVYAGDYATAVLLRGEVQELELLTLKAMMERPPAERISAMPHPAEYADYDVEEDALSYVWSNGEFETEYRSCGEVHHADDQAVGVTVPDIRGILADAGYAIVPLEDAAKLQAKETP